MRGPSHLIIVNSSPVPGNLYGYTTYFDTQGWSGWHGRVRILTMFQLTKKHLHSLIGVQNLLLAYKIRSTNRSLLDGRHGFILWSRTFSCTGCNWGGCKVRTRTSCSELRLMRKQILIHHCILYWKTLLVTSADKWILFPHTCAVTSPNELILELIPIPYYIHLRRIYGA